MSSANELLEALKILSELDDFVDVRLIAKLNWKAIPETYKKTKTTIVGTNKVTEYVLQDTFVVDIQGVGLFQIM
jgi:hypothetical protein